MTSRRSFPSASARCSVALASLWLVACGSSGAGGTGTASGGRSGEGGSSAASGGATGSGGGSTGGATGSGGASTGGAGESGGHGGTIGAGGSTGGTGAGTGGKAAGGSGTGGSGTGGSGSGGSTGTGGATGNGGAAGAMASSGCGMTTWPTASPQMMNVMDSAKNTVSRQFYFALPSGYSGKQPVPLTFAFHYLGGSASAIAGTGYTGHYYGIQPLLPNAIYVAPQGLAMPGPDGGAGQTGFPNTNDQDIAFTRAMVSWSESNFCVDQSRIFSTGFSYGGMMSHTIACEMPDVFRAVGIMSGILIEPTSKCVNHDIAAWITHGESDTTLPYSDGVSAMNRIVSLDHCGATSHAVDPSPCMQYDGCDSADPVVWCPVSGEGHAIPSFGAQAIATFFSQF
jgi:polyhydroxybutyrate depolymerase